MRSTTLTLSGDTTDFTISFQPPIRLDPKKEYEAAFLSLETYNSIPNITEKNNTFKYSTDNGNTWKIIKLPVDAYEYKQIAAEIQRQMVENNDYDEDSRRDLPPAAIAAPPTYTSAPPPAYASTPLTDYTKNPFYINFSTCRLSSLIEITNPTYKIDFGVENSLGPTLGFSTEVLSHGVHKSPKIVDITNISSILINVDFIEGGYVNKTYSQAIHNFSPKVGPGYKIFEQPSPELIFYRVSKDFIPDVRVWLTDQNNNIINLQGERITVRILIKETKTKWKTP